MRGISQQRPKRRPCGKKPLSQGKAAQVIREARRSTAAHRRECRAYFCPGCGAWHTTSHAYGDFT